MITRRTFSKNLAMTALAIQADKLIAEEKHNNSKPNIRLGGPVFSDEYQSPDSWIKSIQGKGYQAAYCPINEDVDDQTINAYKQAAYQTNIVIAEVGAWSNPISPDRNVRKAAIEKCTLKLNLADRIEARCCVNVSGSRGENGFAGPHPDNLTSDTFDLIVETTRKIIDAVKPKRTFFTLETMPWAYPDSTDCYLKLIKAIDRNSFAAHYDPVNLINSPSRYFNNAALLKESFQKLGPYIRSCHAKDILLSTKLTTHLDEVTPGTGYLDYAVFLHELNKLNNVPLMMEHMKRDEYPIAAKYIRKVGQKISIHVS